MNASLQVRVGAITLALIVSVLCDRSAGQERKDEGKAKAGAKEDVRPVVSTLSFASAKYMAQLDNEKFMRGCAKALSALSKDVKSPTAVGLEVSCRLLLDSDNKEDNKKETDDEPLVRSIKSWLKPNENESSVPVAQLLIDDLPQMSASSSDRTNADGLARYKRRIKLAAALGCRNAILSIDQLSNPEETKSLIEAVGGLCGIAKESSKGTMGILIEPRRGRSTGIGVIKKIVDGVRAAGGTGGNIGICLNLSAIADDEGEVWKSDLPDYVKVVVIETYRFIDGKTVRESNRDYGRIIAGILAKKSAPGAHASKAQRSPETAKAPAFAGDVVLRYLGRESYMDGVKKSLMLLAQFWESKKK
jgi:hypothetical protein